MFIVISYLFVTKIILNALITHLLARIRVELHMEEQEERERQREKVSTRTSILLTLFSQDRLCL